VIGAWCPALASLPFLERERPQERRPSSLSDPTWGGRYLLSYGPDCVLHGSQRDAAPVATGPGEVVVIALSRTSLVKFPADVVLRSYCRWPRSVLLPAATSALLSRSRRHAASL
jgi:hypothetical protein